MAPETCGIGGDLFALVFEPGQKEPTALNSSGRSGSNASSHALRDQGLVEMPVMGPETVTIPGCVDGWFALAERYGHLAWSERLAPALRYADSGFPVSNELARSLLLRFEQLSPQSIGRHLLPNGRPPQPGETIARPDLATTLRTVAAGHARRLLPGSPGGSDSRGCRRFDLARGSGVQPGRMGETPRVAGFWPRRLDYPAQLPGLSHSGLGRGLRELENR